MKPFINSTRLIAACGLYCGACRKYRQEKCPGCRISNRIQPLTKRLQKCKIRSCCFNKGFQTCAQCNMDVSECKLHNNWKSKLFSVIFRSDRVACIRYIRKNGMEAYAERMSLHEQMTINPESI